MDLHQLRSLPADHIDLLLTAAIEFGVISTQPGTPRPQQVLTVVAQRLGTGLFLRNQIVDSAGYRFRPVEGPLDVRDVLKACHAAQFAYRDTRCWGGSAEQRVLDGIAKAAAMRIPGYELSPWVWQRPVEEAIGYAPPAGWRPEDLGGIEWLDSVDDFTARWGGARIVVLTAPALEDLPALPTRPRVFVLVGHDEAAAVIAEVDRHRIVVESILVLPQAAAWLREQLLV